MLKPSDYFITPGDVARAFRWRHLIGATVGICIIAGLTTIGLGWDVALFAGSIAAAVIWKMDARIPFGAAIACFIGIMVASVIGPSNGGTQGSLREQLAVSAFYCLVIGVALLIREQVMTRKHHHNVTAPQVMSISDSVVAMPLAHAPGNRAVTAPDFVIIGTQRGGTTSLHAYLSAHPQVETPVTKELQQTFDDALHGRAQEYLEWLDFVEVPSKVTS